MLRTVLSPLRYESGRAERRCATRGLSPRVGADPPCLPVCGARGLLFGQTQEPAPTAGCQQRWRATPLTGGAGGGSKPFLTILNSSQPP